LHAVDAFLYFGSVLLITSGLTLLVLDYTAYKASREQMDGTAKAIADQIQNQFHVELQRSVHKLQETITITGEPSCDQGECGQFRQIITTKKYPPYQIVTGLDDKGTLSGKQITYRERMEAPGKVADRDYFRAARDGTLWTFHDDKNEGCHQFILDRI